MVEPMSEVPPDVIAALQASAASASNWHEISGALHRRAATPEDPMHIVASAFDYILQVDRRETGRRPTAFEPMIRFESGETVPPLIERVDGKWVAIWAVVAREVEASPARARLHDLLAERRFEDVRAHGLAAASAYREVATLAHWDALDRADCLIRALLLGRRFGAADIADLRQELLAAADRSLHADDPEPGVALSLLGALVDDPDCPEAVDGLLDLARSTYQGAHLVEDIVELQKRRARGDTARVEELNRDRVFAWLDEAEAGAGLGRVVHLETAARLARETGARNLEELAQQRLQSIPKDELELQHISAEASIPPDIVEQYIRPFTGAETVEQLLVALISHPPATGAVAENRLAVEKSRVEFPLQHLFPRVVLGGDRLPRWSPTSEADREDGDLAGQELLRFQIIGDLMARGLWIGGERVAPEISAVEAFLARLPNWVDRVPTRLAHAFERYWQSDWTAAAFLALPCVEALCRSLVLRLEKGIYQTQRGQRPGQYPGLGVLLRWMREEGLDESWYRYLWTVLASPAGMNLRNEVAHGFALELGPAHAAAVLHMATYLAALEVASRDDTSSDSAGK